MLEMQESQDHRECDNAAAAERVVEGCIIVPEGSYMAPLLRHD